MANIKNHPVYKICCYILTLIIINLTFVSCGYLTQPTEEQTQHVITADDLTPSTTVQDILQSTETDGVDYKYYWLAEDIDGTIDMMRKTSLYDNSTEPEIVAFEKMAQEQQKMLEQEFAILSAVTPQQATNIAVSMVKKAYGISFDEQYYIHLNLYEKEGGGAKWAVYMKLWDSDLDADVELDATTGALLFLNLQETAPTQEGMENTQIAQSYTVHEKLQSGIINGMWDETHESFDATAQKLQEELTAALTDSEVLQGAIVTDVNYALELKQKHKTTQSNVCLVFNITLDDGRALEAVRKQDIAPYVDYQYNNKALTGYTLVFG